MSDVMMMVGVGLLMLAAGFATLFIALAILAAAGPLALIITTAVFGGALFVIGFVTAK